MKRYQSKVNCRTLSMNIALNVKEKKTTQRKQEKEKELENVIWAYGEDGGISIMHPYRSQDTRVSSESCQAVLSQTSG